MYSHHDFPSIESILTGSKSMQKEGPGALAVNVPTDCAFVSVLVCRGEYTITISYGKKIMISFLVRTSKFFKRVSGSKA